MNLSKQIPGQVPGKFPLLDNTDQSDINKHFKRGHREHGNLLFVFHSPRVPADRVVFCLHSPARHQVFRGAMRFPCSICVLTFAHWFVIGLRVAGKCFSLKKECFGIVCWSKLGRFSDRMDACNLFLKICIFCGFCGPGIMRSRKSTKL